MSAGVVPPRPRRSAREDVLDRDWALALAVAFFAAVVVWFGRSIEDFFGPGGPVLVPALVGQTLDDAVGECNQLRLTCSVLARRTSERYPRDVVMEQQPVPGAHVRQGRSISLIVSNGVTIFPMPDVRFESLRNVSLELAHSKLRLAKMKTVPDDDVPASYVVVQDPLPLTSVREGTAVSLTLSKGPPSSIKLPSFVGLSIDRARSDAQAAKVHLGQIVWTPFGPHGPPRGIVVRQAPPAGRNIDPFAPVSLQVSAGPHEYGYLVRQVHATVAVPVRDDAAQLRLEVRDETGTWNVYDGFVQGGQKLDFNVTAIGAAELDTYLDNELVNSTKIGVEPPRTAGKTRRR